jgi:hypothetical protein
LLNARKKYHSILHYVTDNLISKAGLSRIETQDVHIRLTALPKPGELDEFDFRRYRIGEVYDLPAHFASVLLISGCAEPAPAPSQRDTAADSRPRPRVKPPELY